MMGKVLIDVQRAVDVGDLPDDKDFREWVEAVLACDNHGVEVTIRLVDIQESAKLNEQYRHRSGPTNVLSFPFEPLPGVPSLLLGDLVICAPVVRQEAVDQGKTERAHWAHMVVHGLLHLQGYDHQTDGDAEHMETLEKKILGELGFADPYCGGS